ncbi:hypothetical protein VF03_16525, partial [Nostoc linckia z2]
ESYTSKCSFLDLEPIKKHEQYLGRRIKRGLFRSNSGKIYSADLNGSHPNVVFWIWNPLKNMSNI